MQLDRLIIQRPGIDRVRGGRSSAAVDPLDVVHTDRRFAQHQRQRAEDKIQNDHPEGLDTADEDLVPQRPAAFLRAPAQDRQKLGIAKLLDQSLRPSFSLLSVGAIPRFVLEMRRQFRSYILPDLAPIADTLRHLADIVGGTARQFIPRVRIGSISHVTPHLPY